MTMEDGNGRATRNPYRILVGVLFGAKRIIVCTFFEGVNVAEVDEMV